jgi:hypothetical protein
VPGTRAIHLESWIVQDGNYDDFSRGQDAAFAVEFYPDELVVVSVGAASARAVLQSRARFLRLDGSHIHGWPMFLGLGVGVGSEIVAVLALPPFFRHCVWF